MIHQELGEKSQELMKKGVDISSVEKAGEGEVEQDEMAKLEAKAEAEMAKKKAMAAKSAVAFVRGDEQSQAVQDMAKKVEANPDEIDVGDDSSDEEENGEDKAEENEDGEPPKKKAFHGVEKQAIPSAIYGGLKKDDD